MFCKVVDRHLQHDDKELITDEKSTVNMLKFGTLYSISNIYMYMYINYVVGTQKNSLNETVLLSTQKACLS